MKPYKGEIHNWRIIHMPQEYKHLFEGLGIKIIGKPVGHPTRIDWILTSEVISITGETCITLNSTYKLVGDELETFR